MNKKDREVFYSKLEKSLTKQDYITFIKIMAQLEKELTDLRKKFREHKEMVLEWKKRK